MTSYGEWVHEPRPDELIFGTKWRRVPNTWPSAIVHAAENTSADFQDYADAVFTILHSQYRLEHPDE